MKNLFCLILTVGLLRITGIAQINLPAGETYTQNFDGMGKLATAKLPSGWKAGTSTYPGIMISYFSAGTSTAFNAGTSMASNASGGIYNFGAGDPDAATDRAVGGLSTGTAGKSVIIFVSLYNSGNDTIGSYTISYDVEKYRNGSNSLGFSVMLLFSLDGDRWKQQGLPAIFSPDIDNNGSLSVPIKTESISRTFTLFNTVPPKTTYYLAWCYSVNSDDLNASTTSAQALGIDNVSVSAKAKVSPPVLTAGTLNGFGNVCVGTTSAPNTFTLTGKNLGGTPVTIGPAAGYSFSTSATESFTNTLSPSYSGSSLNTTIYVKFSPASAQSYNDNIPISGGNAAAINIAVSGIGVNTRPTVSTGNATNITFESATLAGTISNMGCSSMTGYGIEYSTTDGFTNGSGTTISGSNLTGSSFSSNVAGLPANTTYYYHAYATNSGGTSYGAQKSFTTTTQPAKPLEVIAVPATDTMPTSFTANWHPAGGDTISYRLDVSTTNDFIDDQATTTVVKWTFPDLSADAVVDTANSINANKTITATGTSDPTFTAAGAASKAARAIGWDNGSGASYWQVELNTTGQKNLQLSSKQRSSSTGPKDFKIQYKIGAGIWTDIASPAVTVEEDFTTGVVANKPLPEVCSNQPSVLIRWIMTSNTSVGGGAVGSTGASLIDDIIITGSQNTYVAGYKDTLVNDTSLLVTGLSPNTTYYYRVRATDGNVISPNSNIISVTTKQEEIEEPVLLTTLFSFSGKEQDNKNLLQWSTAIENKNQGFDLQRSSDGTHFQSIGFIPSAAPDGNSTENIDYSFNDYDIMASDSQFYRLEVMNLDGTGNLSDTILIRKEKKAEVITIDGLYPNPASGSINAVFSTPTWEKVSFWIIDARGNIVKQLTLNPVAGSNTFNIDLTGVLPGTYNLKCISQTGMVVTRKFMVR